MCARALATLLVSVLFAVAASQFVTTQAAGTFTVNSLGDTPDASPGNGACADAGGQCTLRAAIQEANTNSFDTDTINFSVTGTINLTGPLPALTNSIINGPGSSQLTVRRDTGGDYRVFLINSAVVSITGLTVSNGKTPDGTAGPVFGVTGEGGGGILAIGTVTLTDVVVTGNRTGNGGPGGSSTGGFGGFGGGISGGGTLTMTKVTVSNNITGDGATGAHGGGGGRGGGISFSGSALTMTDCLVTGNMTGNGASGTNGGASGGGGGDGAGLYVESGTLNFTNVVIHDNDAGNGNFGATGGRGAGLFTFPGVNTTLTNVTVSENTTGDGGGGTAGQGGFGGGIENNGIMTIKRSTIRGNGTGTPGPSEGTGGSGGAGIFNNAVLKVINSTISGNVTGGIGGHGGGIYHNGSTLILTNCTITANTAFTQTGNGVYKSLLSNTATIQNTIIAQNIGGPDTFGDFISQGHNLIGNADDSTGFTGTDLVGTTAAPLNAMLGPLADNSGPTLTHALLAGSPALDAGSNALAVDENSNALVTDQRGSARIADSPDADATAIVDIGAFEFSQNFQSIADQMTNEDTPVSISFNTGDGGPGITSITASSSDQVLVPDANLTITGAGALRTLQITPAANQSGVTVITLTMNFSGGGMITDDFQLSVLPVNDAPTFTKGPDRTLLEDAAAQSIPNWATGMDAGPNESGQALSFTVTNDFGDLFSAAPAISPSGTLTYTLAPNRWGVATVTVLLKDDGGTANGGQDTSTAQTFTIAVTPVNDAPSFTKGADQTIAEDAGFQFINNWATNISTGPNESDSATFEVTNNTNTALFSIQPSVNTFGSLTYTPASNASGTSDITIQLKDLAGTANGGSDTSASQTFTITVTAVNDAPVNNVPFSASVIQQTPLVFSPANFNAFSVTDVDAGVNPIRVTLTVTEGTLSLGSIGGLTFNVGDGVDDVTMTFTGNVAAINTCLTGSTFKPNNGFSGLATLQITTDDQGHSGAGGAKSTTSTVSIFVQSGGRFSFNTAVYGVNENGGTATITVLRAGGNAGTATVKYATSNGTATAGSSCSSGVDYLGTAGTFTWGNGDSSVRTFTITICNDGSAEGNETVNLTLSDPGGTGSLGTQPTATLTIGNDDGAVLLTEELTEHAVALDLVFLTRDPFSLTSLFNLGSDQRRRVSLFVWQLGLLPGDTPSSVTVVARDDEGRIYDLPVEALSPVLTVDSVTQVVVRLPDNVIGAPRDLRVKVTLRGSETNEAFIKIAAP